METLYHNLKTLSSILCRSSVKRNERLKQQVQPQQDPKPSLLALLFVASVVQGCRWRLVRAATMFIIIVGVTSVLESHPVLAKESL
jgi:hypothetical protein